MHNKRRQNNNMGGGAGGQHRHNNNRPRRFTNNRPSGGGEGGGDAASVSRTRRNATQNREKYQMMARDALSSGDRVLNEYYLQHADHYHRVLLALPPEEAPRPQFQRNYNQPVGENGTGEPQQNGQGTDGNTHDSSAEASNGHDRQTGGSAHDNGHGGLPSFITQPDNPEEPRD